MILPAAAERPIVVFKVWPSLAYSTRLAISLGLIAAGLAVQVATESFLWGGMLLVLGNLFLLVSGYDNRVDLVTYDPNAEWTRVELSRLAELRRLDRDIRRWDTSALDVTNPLGLVAFFVVAAGMAALGFFFPGPVRILVFDAALLLLPHWLTGIRSVLRLPGLLVKVETLQRLLAASDDAIAGHDVQLLMLLRGGDTRIPDDVKLRIMPAGRHEDFLGLYGQVVLNEVQGRSYPYFYVVLVARRGFGLHQVFRKYRAPGGITREMKPQDEVDVLVLRQTTTKKSGYHTDPAAAETIFREGLKLAEAAAGGSLAGSSK
jgi:hypothetical protein